MMEQKDRRVLKDRRSDARRKSTDSKRGKNRGIVDRRGKMERRNQHRRMEDREEKISEDFEKIFSDQIEGRNAVLELLESNEDINKIYVTKGEKRGSINKIIAIAKEKKVIVVEKDKKQMEQMAQTQNYQGVIAVVPPYKYAEIEDILDVAKKRKEDPFILILDRIEDTHNLGAIIRTAEIAGVHGIIIPKRRAASVNSTVSKVASGALEYMKIARVNNISDAIEILKENEIWVCGTSIDAEKYYFDQDLKGPIAIVIGNEENGMGSLVEKNCDFSVKIPMKGHIESLNASVSAGIILYEVLKQRNDF